MRSLGTFTHKRMPIFEILSLAHAGLFDYAREFQRVFTPSRAWQSTIIRRILQRNMSGVLVFRTMRPSRKRGKYQIIDGICRTTSIKSFFDGHLKTEKGLTIRFNGQEYAVGNMTWQEVGEQVGKEFINAVMKSCIGVDEFPVEMTDAEAAQLFRDLNAGNPLTHQEKRQAMLGNVSEWVRSCARTGDEYELHPLFNETLPLGMALKRKRMNYDEVMAHCLQYTIDHQAKKSAGIYARYVDRAVLDELYRGAFQLPASLDILEKHGHYTRMVFEHVRQIILAAPHPRMHTKTEPQIVQLFLLILQFRRKYGEKITFNYPVLAKALWNAFGYLTTKAHYPRKVIRDHSNKTPYVYLLARVSPAELRKKFTLILDQLPSKPEKFGVLIRETKTFSRADICRKCDAQGGLCAGCGTVINESTAQGDHIIPVDDGGATIYSNLQALCQPCNGSKGKKSMKAWKAWKRTHQEERISARMR